MAISNTSRNVLLVLVVFVGAIGWCSLFGCTKQAARPAGDRKENSPAAVQPPQRVAATKVKMEVTEAAVGKDDKAGIERQQVCPVSGEKLGGMGDPVKVLIDGHPVYLCCQGCVAKVKQDPETYLRKATQSQQNR